MLIISTVKTPEGSADIDYQPCAAMDCKKKKEVLIVYNVPNAVLYKIFIT